MQVKSLNQQVYIQRAFPKKQGSPILVKDINKFIDERLQAYNLIYAEYTLDLVLCGRWAFQKDDIPKLLEILQELSKNNYSEILRNFSSMAYELFNQDDK